MDAVLLLEEAGFEVKEFAAVEKAIAFLETKAPGCGLGLYRRSHVGEARRRGTRSGRQ